MNLDFSGGSAVKNLPAIYETWVRSLGREDSLEEGMATHSNILAWRIPWTEEPGGYSPWDCKESDMTERLKIFQLSGHEFEQTPKDSEGQEA